MTIGIGRPDLTTNVKFLKNLDRVTNSDELKIEIENALSFESSEYWTQHLADLGVPVDTVVPPEAIFDDPQAKAVEILIDYTDSTSGITSIPGLPLRFNGKRPQVRKTAPHRK